MNHVLNSDRPDKVALVEGDNTFTYAHIESRIEQFASGVLAGRRDLEEARVAFLIPAGVDYVTALHGVWRAGGIAIPLNVAAAESEWEHCLTSAGVTQVIADAQTLGSIEGLCGRLSIPIGTVRDSLADSVSPLPVLSPTRRAMIVFTSGTTSKPKGAVTTHGNIAAQIETLITAWEWQEDDVIPLFLPLHHVHGIINVLSCALWAGATVHAMPKLDLPALSAQVAADA